MKNLLPFIACCFFIISCKNDSKKQNEINTNANISQEKKTFKNKEVENALYNGYFIKNDQGFNVSIYNNAIYLFKLDPSAEERNNHFFLHIIPKKGEVINMDFSPSEHLLNPDLTANYANVLVYKRELPANIKDYDINLGQFTNDGRTWAIYIQPYKLNKAENSYKNEYAAATKTNGYLSALNQAFDQGYFLKHETGFDLLLDGHTLYYIMPNRQNADLKNMFFLHVKFDGKQDLVNLDFEGDAFEIDSFLDDRFKSFIVLKRNIPNRGNITEFATGQFNNEGRLWSYVYEPEKLKENMAFVYNGQYGDVIK